MRRCGSTPPNLPYQTLQGDGMQKQIEKGRGRKKTVPSLQSVHQSTIPQRKDFGKRVARRKAPNEDGSNDGCRTIIIGAQKSHPAQPLQEYYPRQSDIRGVRRSKSKPREADALQKVIAMDECNQTHSVSDYDSSDCDSMGPVHSGLSHVSQDSLEGGVAMKSVRQCLEMARQLGACPSNPIESSSLKVGAVHIDSSRGKVRSDDAVDACTTEPTTVDFAIPPCALPPTAIPEGTTWTHGRSGIEHPEGAGVLVVDGHADAPLDIFR